MRTLRSSMMVLGASAAMLIVTATAVHADPSDLDRPLINPETGGQYALYHGEYIDLSLSWEGAQICVQQDDASFNCYETESEYRAAEGLDMPAAGPHLMDRNDCVKNYVCLWANQNYTSTRAQFNQSGSHYLDKFGMENDANSFYNNRSSDTVMIDFVTVPPQYLETAPYQTDNKLSTNHTGRADWLGSWNNKIDAVNLSPQ